MWICVLECKCIRWLGLHLYSQQNSKGCKGLDFPYSTHTSFLHLLLMLFTFVAPPQKNLMPVNPEYIIKTSIRLPGLIKLQLWRVYKWSQGDYNDGGERHDSALGTGINHSLPCWVSQSLNPSEIRVDTA